MEHNPALSGGVIFFCSISGIKDRKQSLFVCMSLLLCPLRKGYKMGIAAKALPRGLK
ncbi:MAG TPA: hypothetical protein PK074_10100 [Spirochaetales bacterium]|nr:hypothetical protein [Spirochaetales bacterium]